MNSPSTSSSNTTTPLAPCPFCGSASIESVNTTHIKQVWCNECRVVVVADTGEGAIAAWNRRTAAASIASRDEREQRIEELVRLVNDFQDKSLGGDIGGALKAYSQIMEWGDAALRSEVHQAAPSGNGASPASDGAAAIGKHAAPTAQDAPPKLLERRIVCAAIRAENGDLIVGIRHYSTDMRYQINARHDGRRFENRFDDDQGFVNTWGEYLTRKEAYVIAKANGQIIRPEACPNETLYSEGLY